MNMEDLLKIKNIYNNIPNGVKKHGKASLITETELIVYIFTMVLMILKKLLMKIKNYGLKVLRCMVTKKKMMHGCQNFSCYNRNRK